MSQPIPQPPGIPLLGNIFDIDPKNTWKSLNDLSDKYGPIFKINALGTQIIFIGSASLLSEICDETRFRKCVTGPVVEIRAATHDGLFTAYDHEKMWGIAHRIMAPLLTKPSTDALFPGMRDTAAVFVEKMQDLGKDSMTPVDIVRELKTATLQAVMLSFFSQSHNYIHGTEPPMIKAMDSATLEAMKRPTRPKILNLLIHQRQYDKDVRTMRDFGAKVIADRKASSSTNNSHNETDMLHALLNSQDPQTGLGLNDSQVIDEIISICIGTATAPNLVAFALYYLLKNPTALSKARSEISSTLSADEPLTLTTLLQLHYCEAILRESIRLSAVAPGFNIEPLPPSPSSENPKPATPPTTLSNGKYLIPPATPIIAILHAVNRDPSVFSDPEAFIPERMLDEPFKALPAGVKKWFGNGKRECAGKEYGWRWSLMLLVCLIRGVEVELVDRAYEVKIEGAFSVEPVGFDVRVGRRT